MTTLLIFLIAFAALAFTKGIWKKAVGLVLAVLVYAGASGVYNPAMERWVKVATTTQEAEAGFATKKLVVLLGLGLDERQGQSGVPTYALPRLFKAIEVMQVCLDSGADCTLLVSGGPTGSKGHTEAEVYRDRILLAAPGLKSRIAIESASRNTWENAKYASAWASAHGYDHATLVTSLLHMPRSQAYFAHFGLHTDASPSEAVLPSPTWTPSGWNLFMVDVYIHEQIGFGRYKLYERMGWNSK